MPFVWLAVTEPCRRTGCPCALRRLRPPVEYRRGLLPSTWGGSSSLSAWAAGTGIHGARGPCRGGRGEPRGCGGIIWRRDGHRSMLSVPSQVSRRDRRRCTMIATTRASSCGATTAWSAAIKSYRVVVIRNGVASPLLLGATVATLPKSTMVCIRCPPAVPVPSVPNPTGILGLSWGRVYGMIATARKPLLTSRAACRRNILRRPGAVLRRP
jgi:hypothetical protein